MYVHFDKDGVLHVKPETYNDAALLKHFCNEFQTHGARMIEIETELDPQYQEQYSSGNYGRYNDSQMRRYGYYESPYGYVDKRFTYDDVPPFSPRAEYNNPNREVYNRRGVDESNGHTGPNEVDSRRGIDRFRR